jgi:single-strand DNA-binding protein
MSNYTLSGNLTADPELRFTPSGSAVASFTIASTPRYFDRDASEWKDGETMFMRCSIWNEYAENVAESLRRGDRVIATGRLSQRNYETREGEKRTVIEMTVEEMGPALRFVTSVTSKAQSQPKPVAEPVPDPKPEPRARAQRGRSQRVQAVR